jgi:hypothetical protein
MTILRLLHAAMATGAAVAGIDSNGKMVEPHEHRPQGTTSVIPPKASRKRNSHDRSQSGRSESTVTCTDGKKPRLVSLVWTPELCTTNSSVQNSREWYVD